MGESGHDIQMPPKDHVLAWLDSETAFKTYKTLFAIDLLQHGIWDGPGGLNTIYYDADVAKLPGEKQLEWLEEQMPIKDIHHAIFIPKINKLMVDDNFFLDQHRDFAIENLQQKARNDQKLPNLSHVDFNSGVVATIKENGWKIFRLNEVNETELFPESARGLSGQGYLLMRSELAGSNHPEDGRLKLITAEPVVPADQE